jgi:nucleoside-diphosphate-sugar epimerase
MTAELHVIFGTGPVGCWTARALRRMGKRVRAVHRSGAKPGLLPDDVELVSADVSDSATAREAARGASVLYQALNPPYHRWHELFPGLQASALAAAQPENARYVSIENLYMYDSFRVITEESAFAPRSKKGLLRQKMAEEVMALHERGEVRATALRASDYYGPGVTGSALGELTFGRLVAGKKPQVLGSARLAHSFAYIEDVGDAAAVLGTSDVVLGRAWIAPHAPARTQGEMVEIAGRVTGTSTAPSVISPLMVRLAGLFSPEVRASREMMYQFTEPFVVDSKRIERELSLVPTPIETGMERTVKWYQEKESLRGGKAPEAIQRVPRA